MYNYLHNISNVFTSPATALRGYVIRWEVALYRLSRARVSIDIDASSYKYDTLSDILN